MADADEVENIGQGVADQPTVETTAPTAAPTPPTPTIPTPTDNTSSTKPSSTNTSSSNPSTTTSSSTDSSPTKKVKTGDLIPLTAGLCRAIQFVSSNFPLLVLFDSGSAISWLNRDALPPGANPATVDKLRGTTMAGTFESNQEVYLEDFSLPEFHPSRFIPTMKARVFSNESCRYHLIVGRDNLRLLGADISFSDNTVTIDDKTVNMRTYPQSRLFGATPLGTELYFQIIEDMHDDEWIYPDNVENPKSDAYATMGDSTYDPADLASIVNDCKYLSEQQRFQLLELLQRHPKLFDGVLRHYTGGEIHLDTDPSVEPKQVRYYPVAHVNLALFKRELDRLCSIGVLERSGRSEWISGTFITPKKDGKVRWVSDFRALNKAIKRKVYPLPKIQDVLLRRKGYKFVTKLDLSMQYYTFMLDKASRELTTIATPFGLYRYCRLPMGVSQSPDVAQEIMEQVLEGIEGIECYIDDIAVFSDSYESHIATLAQVFERLESAGFAVNPLKCEWAVQETDFLGHWLTPTGLKPWKKKIDAILKLDPPTNIHQLRSFLGMVTYYRDMWPRRSHILAPITKLTGTKEFVWDKDCQQAFDEMKALIATDTLLRYPDHNKPFEIETDASDYQLGAVIKQDGQPVAYYTRKLNDAQRNYTTIEKELLSIVETLREFRTMLLGAEIHVHTDHKNLTHELTAFQTQRVMRWRLVIEEFGPQFHYKKGSLNYVADALSRLPRRDEPTFESEHAVPALLDKSSDEVGVGSATQSESDALGMFIPEHDVFFVDDEMAECLLYHPEPIGQNLYPFRFADIATMQNADQALMQRLQTDPNRYQNRLLAGHNIVTFILNPQEWRIALPTAMVRPVVEYFHQATVHAQGITRLESTLSKFYYHPQLRTIVKDVVGKCDLCQRAKSRVQAMGQLAPRDAPLAPWTYVHVDSIGNWKIQIRKVTLEFNALTMIDPVTNLVEIVPYPSKSKNSRDAARLFENTWLSRYPRPLGVVHDGGPEFQDEFQTLLRRAGIRAKTISPYTPTANAIIEAVHKTIGQVLRVYLELRPPRVQGEANRLMDTAFATAMHATRCAAHSSLNHLSPGAVVFNRDMYLDIPIQADLITLRDLRQRQIDVRLLSENARRRPYDFKVGDQVYVINGRSHGDQAAMRKRGPYPIVTVHTNNTVTIQRANYQQRITIRRVELARL